MRFSSVSSHSVEETTEIQKGTCISHDISVWTFLSRSRPRVFLSKIHSKRITANRGLWRLSTGSFSPVTLLSAMLFQSILTRPISSAPTNPILKINALPPYLKVQLLCNSAFTDPTHTHETSSGNRSSIRRYTLDSLNISLLLLKSSPQRETV